MPTKYRASSRTVTLLNHCRELRHEATLAERLLWQRLNDRHMDGAKFRRQHQFGPFILDFYCAECRLAIEVDGGQHFTEEGLARDEERTRYLEERGILVLRFTNPQVLKEMDSVLEAILEAVRSGRTSAGNRGDNDCTP